MLIPLRALVILAVLLCSQVLIVESAPALGAFEPARTWLFAVGVLKFDDPYLAG